MATKLLPQILIIVLLLISGCAIQSPPTPTPTATPSPTLLPTLTPQVISSKQISLILWLPDELFLEDKPGRKALEREIQSFEQAHAGVKVKVYVKKARGKGGIADLLLSAHKVAPSVLPDLVVLDAAEAAWLGEELFQPLEEVPEGLFPFSVSSNFVYLAVDVDHLAYNTGIVTSPLSTWWDVTENLGGLLIFPSGEALAAQYLALGGRFRDEGGRLILQKEILAEALRLWEKGLENGAISPLSRQLKDAEEGWRLYLTGKVAMVKVRASLFAAAKGKLRQTAFAPLPSMTPIAWGWVAGIVTQDPRRKEAAEGLVKWLLQPERNRQWTLEANLLPVHRETCAQAEEHYLLFLCRLLESAHPSPPSTLLEPLREALWSVLSGKTTPDEAARRATNIIP